MRRCWNPPDRARLGAQRGRQRCGAAVAAICLSLFIGRPTLAFKWSSCPTPPLPVYPSALGATTAPFIHPGHALTIVLNQDETASTGGFGLTASDNTITIRFRSLFGATIELDARTATATSPSVLTFTFPDTSDGDIEALAGPVEILVQSNGGVVAWIRATDLVALPRTTDITSAVLGNAPDLSVPAALGADGDVWVPASFHGDPMVMPGCPGDFINPAPIRLGGATVDGPLVSTFNPFDRIRGVVGYLGDMEINGVSFYGMISPQPIKLTQQSGTLGVSICRMNDALDIVMRVRGNQSWATEQSSPFRLVAAASRAISLHLTAAPMRPGNQPQSVDSVDSFGDPCVPGNGH